MNVVGIMVWCSKKFLYVPVWAETDVKEIACPVSGEESGQDPLIIHSHLPQTQSFGWLLHQLTEESTQCVDSNCIQTAVAMTNSLSKEPVSPPVHNR